MRVVIELEYDFREEMNFVAPEVSFFIVIELSFLCPLKIWCFFFFLSQKGDGLMVNSSEVDRGKVR